MKKLFALIMILTLTGLSIMKPLYNTLHSYVTPINKLNFENQINKIRQTTKQLSIIHFYKANDGESKEFAEKYDQWCNEYQGVFKISSADCDDDFDICEKEKITKFPTIKIYPPFPTPTVIYEGPLDTKKLTAFAAKYMESNVIEITSDSINAFINDSPSVPKALLFTDNTKIPLIYKGLSVNFEKKLFFGIIKSSQTELVERYNIKKIPALIVVKATEKKPYYFKDNYTFKAMFEFLNVFSETYVPGGGSSLDSPATKQWLTEICPEMNEKSANDICLKNEGTLCVILLDKQKPEKEYLDIMKQLHSEYDRKISRGSEFKFMWLSTELEPQWQWQYFFQVQELPSIVVLNPGKRKRFIKHEGNIDLKSIQTTLERINGGDAKFTILKNSWPEFSIRK